MRVAVQLQIKLGEVSRADIVFDLRSREEILKSTRDITVKLQLGLI